MDDDWAFLCLFIQSLHHVENGPGVLRRFVVGPAHKVQVKKFTALVFLFSKFLVFCFVCLFHINSSISSKKRKSAVGERKGKAFAVYPIQIDLLANKILVLRVEFFNSDRKLSNNFRLLGVGKVLVRFHDPRFDVLCQHHHCHCFLCQNHSEEILVRVGQRSLAANERNSVFFNWTNV